MELKIIVESKNFDDNESLKKRLDSNPCELCLFGKGMMCIERKYCRWKSHREIYVKKLVCE